MKRIGARGIRTKRTRTKGIEKKMYYRRDRDVNNRVHEATTKNKLHNRVWAFCSAGRYDEYELFGYDNSKYECLEHAINR